MTMHPLGLTDTAKIIATLALGFVFGVILVQSKVAFRKSLMEQFNFKDNTFAIVFLLSLAAGVPLFHFAAGYGLIELKASGYNFWGVVVGALMTGVGVALCGHVPETALASIACGRLYSLWILLGMLAAFPLSRWVGPTIQAYVADRPAPFDVGAWVAGDSLFYIVPIGCVFVALFLRLLQAPGAGMGGGGDKKPPQ